jgi:hypothetical protein
MNPILAQQLIELQKNWPQATAIELSSGAHLITVPEVRVPLGWNKESVTVLFLTPPAYPIAQPDCFWTSPKGLRLQNGTVPQNSNDSPIPEVVPTTEGTWFSWHVQQWNANRDSLVTYFNVIINRFRSAL